MGAGGKQGEAGGSWRLGEERRALMGRTWAESDWIGLDWIVSISSANYCSTKERKLNSMNVFVLAKKETLPSLFLVILWKDAAAGNVPLLPKPALLSHVECQRS